MSITESAKRVRPKIRKDNRLQKEIDWQFIPESVFYFYLQGKKPLSPIFFGLI